jgi:hypothetical protein
LVFLLRSVQDPVEAAHGIALQVKCNECKPQSFEIVHNPLAEIRSGQFLNIIRGDLQSNGIAVMANSELRRKIQFTQKVLPGIHLL